MNTIAFNTARTYSKDGQRIAARIIESDPAEFGDCSIIAMVDIDRGIKNVYLMFGDLTERNVMEAYDAGMYAHHFDVASDYEALYLTYAELTLIAGKVNPIA
jgi:hypothetical protein